MWLKARLRSAHSTSGSGADGAKVTAVIGNVLTFVTNGVGNLLNWIDLGYGKIEVMANGTYKFTAYNCSTTRRRRSSTAPSR